MPSSLAFYHSSGIFGEVFLQAPTTSNSTNWNCRDTFCYRKITHEHIAPAVVTASNSNCHQQNHSLIGNQSARRCVLESLTEGPTRPISSTVTHAGIANVKRWAFSMP
jgi:hypothetical protein